MGKFRNPFKWKEWWKNSGECVKDEGPAAETTATLESAQLDLTKQLVKAEMEDDEETAEKISKKLARIQHHAADATDTLNKQKESELKKRDLIERHEVNKAAKHQIWIAAGTAVVGCLARVFDTQLETIGRQTFQSIGSWIRKDRN